MSSSASRHYCTTLTMFHFRGLWSYNTSKSAANALTQQMAVSLGKRFITVNAILPG